MERLFHAYDCTNNLIIFNQYAYNDKLELIKILNEEYVKATKALSAPTLIIEFFTTCKTRYYFRTTSWGGTVLIGVTFSNEIGQVKEYCENPSGSSMLTLLKPYLIKGTISIILQDEFIDNTLEDLSQ